jgi:predicted ABC-type ATPase
MLLEFEKTLTIIAGPNGSGKTTFANKNYSQSIENNLFLNADLIAKEISPNDVNKADILAARKFLNRLDKCFSGNNSVVIETTLAGKSLLRRIAIARQQGFLVRLIFLWIKSIELCDFRVKLRVTLGGHNIPLDVIGRRYVRGLENLPMYLNAVDEYEVFEASEMPVLIFNKSIDSTTSVIDKSLFDELQSVIGHNLIT